MNEPIPIEDKISIARERLDKAIQTYKPIAVFGLFSGGHDSLSACYVASTHPQFTAMVHINTGIGIEATREFVRKTCRKRYWKLLEYRASENTFANGGPDPQNYDDICMRGGFPGTALHGQMYVRLKERQLDRLARDQGATTKRKIAFVTGARSDESVRRMRLTDSEADDRGRVVWINPIHDWSKQDTTDLIEYAGLKRNLIVDLIHKSGECLCGAFAKPGELEELKQWPQTRPCYDRIKALEIKVRAAGFPWGWEESPPKEYLEEKRGQTIMEPMRQFLCWKCNAKNT